MANQSPKGRELPPGIERRGNSFRVSIYAGRDPLTGKRHYLRHSTTDEGEARRVLRRFRVQIDEQNHAKTRGQLQLALSEWLKVQDLEESTLDAYRMYIRRYISPALGAEPVSQINAKVLEDFYAQLRNCRARCDGIQFIEHRTEDEHDCRTVRHRWPPGRPTAKTRESHDCDRAGCQIIECMPHHCRPLEPASIRKIHFIISGALAAAVRWEWVSKNPAAVAKKPSAPTPRPMPPTTTQVAKIIEGAWSEDAMWGLLVWLVMVTGVRRAELLALRWSDIDFDGARVYVRRNIVRSGGRTIEKLTKVERMRLISIDPATVELLGEHRARYESTMRSLEASALSPIRTRCFSPTNLRPTGRAIPAASPTGMNGSAAGSASTAIFTPCVTTPRPSCSAPALSYRPSPAVSDTAVEAPQPYASTPPGFSSLTADPPRSSAVGWRALPPAGSELPSRCCPRWVRRPGLWSGGIGPLPARARPCAGSPGRCR